MPRFLLAQSFAPGRSGFSNPYIASYAYGNEDCDFKPLFCGGLAHQIISSLDISPEVLKVVRTDQCKFSTRRTCRFVFMISCMKRRLLSVSVTVVRFASFTRLIV